MRTGRPFGRPPFGPMLADAVVAASVMSHVICPTTGRRVLKKRHRTVAAGRQGGPAAAQCRLRGGEGAGVTPGRERSRSSRGVPIEHAAVPGFAAAAGGRRFRIPIRAGVSRFADHRAIRARVSRFSDPRLIRAGVSDSRIPRPIPAWVSQIAGSQSHPGMSVPNRPITADLTMDGFGFLLPGM